MSSLAKARDRLKEALNLHSGARRGLRDKTTVLVQDLHELLRDWERMDDDARARHCAARGDLRDAPGAQP